jgi:ribonucleoside-diphosphate reductase alpha chain
MVVKNQSSARVRLSPKRSGFTQEAKIGADGVSVFVSTGEYEDGRLGEVFIDISGHEHAGVRAWANNFAILLSHALQYGLPLEALVDQFSFTRFEPNGIVKDDANMRFCTSVLDYVFRMLGVHYLKRDDLAQVPPDRGTGGTDG